MHQQQPTALAATQLDASKAPRENHGFALPVSWPGLSETLVNEAAKLAADMQLDSALDLTGSAKDSRVADALDRSLSWIGGRHLDGTIAAALSGLSDVLGKGHSDASREFWKQAGNLVGSFGADGAAGMPAPLGRGGSNKPDMPFKPDDSLYGMHEGKLDDNDDPEGGGDGQGTGVGGVGMDPSELHQWGEPPEPAPSAPAGATAGVGSQPATDPKSFSVPVTPNPEGAGDEDIVSAGRALKGLWDASPVHIGLGAETAVNYPKLPGGTLGFNLTLNLPPYSQYVDPDAVDATQVPAVTPEQLDARINGRKLPVNPDGGQGSFAADGAPLRHTPGIDPTVAHYENEIGIGTTSELSSKVTTAPIDYAPEGDRPTYSPGPAGGDSGSDTHVEPPLP